MSDTPPVVEPDAQTPDIEPEVVPEPEQPVDPEQDPDDLDEPEGAGEEDDGPKRHSTKTPPEVQARRYRHQARAAEASLADANEHIAELQAELLKTRLTDKLADTSLFAKLVPRDQWVDERGRIDAEKLDVAVDALLESHPNLAVRRPSTGRQTPRSGTPVDSRLQRAFPPVAREKRSIADAVTTEFR